MLIYTHNHNSKQKSVSRICQGALSAFVRSTRTVALNACHRRGKSGELLSFVSIPMFAVESGSSEDTDCISQQYVEWFANM